MSLAISSPSLRPSPPLATLDASRVQSPAAILAILGVITLIGAGLRFYQLDAQSLWLDEISSLRNAKAFGAGGLDALAGVDQVAPLHSIVLWTATLIGGEDAVSLRMPSVIAGILTIPATHLAAVRMFRVPVIGLIAAALVATSPFGIWYSQEGRMYALLLLMATIYVAVVWPVIDRPLRVWELLATMAVTAVGLGMHHYMALISASFGLFLLVQGQAFKPRSLAWAGTQIVAALIFSYWMLLTADRVAGAAGNAKPAVLLWTPYTFYSFLVGFSFGPSTTELALARGGVVDVAVGYGWAILLVAISAGLLGIVGLRRIIRSDMRAAGTWALIWLTVPLALAILATFVTNIQFNVRYVVCSYTALAIVLAVALWHVGWERRAEGAPQRRSLVTAAAGVVLIGCMLASLFNHYRDPRYAKADVRALAGFIDRMPRDVTLIEDNNRVAKVLKHYGVVTPVSSLQVDYRFPSRSPQMIWRNFMEEPSAAAGEIWLIEYRSWEADPDAYLRARLDAHARLVHVHSWPGVTVRRYEPKPPGAGRAALPHRDRTYAKLQPISIGKRNDGDDHGRA